MESHKLLILEYFSNQGSVFMSRIKDILISDFVKRISCSVLRSEHREEFLWSYRIS